MLTLIGKLVHLMNESKKLYKITGNSSDAEIQHWGRNIHEMAHEINNEILARSFQDLKELYKVDSFLEIKKEENFY